jgi:hypothetical protein
LAGLETSCRQGDTDTRPNASTRNLRLLRSSVGVTRCFGNWFPNRSIACIYKSVVRRLGAAPDEN